MLGFVKLLSKHFQTLHDASKLAEQQQEQARRSQRKCSPECFSEAASGLHKVLGSDIELLWNIGRRCSLALAESEQQKQ